MRSLLTIAPLEDHDRKIYQKPDFMFEDVVPNIDQQLLVREGQWIFTLDGEKYYLSSSKRYFLLSFFQCVTGPRKMNWQVTWTIDSVHGSFDSFFPRLHQERSPLVYTGLTPREHSTRHLSGGEPSYGPDFW